MDREDGAVRIGAGVPYARVIAELSDGCPALAQASRTVGSPQIRNRGTIGGNLGTASPAGDAHPPLLAAGRDRRARLHAAARGRIPLSDFFPARAASRAASRTSWSPRSTSRSPGAPRAVRQDRHPQRDGDRRLLVRASRIDPERRRVGTGIGSAGPTPLRAPEAEEFLTGAARRARRAGTPTADRRRDAHALRRAGRAAARPIDDVRGTAAYRRHALGVLAARTLGLGMRLTCTVNGEQREADVDWEGESLLYVLRERLGLPGSKNACEQGECGSCSVLLDGVLVCACLVLAAPGGGPRVITVEGLAPTDDDLDPVQQAFVDAGAVQCGFCTPGLIIATHDLLEPQPGPGRTARSARRSRATSAAARATRRSSTRCGSPPRAR